MRDPVPHPSLVPGSKPDENAIRPGQSCPFSIFKAISAAYSAISAAFSAISAAYSEIRSPQLILRISAAYSAISSAYGAISAAYGAKFPQGHIRKLVS